MFSGKYFNLFWFLFAVFCVEAIGSFFTMSSVQGWYHQLIRPDWTPPDWVFGPVWTILYIAMGVSGWLIYIQKKRTPNRNVALFIYLAQLISNLLWTFFFFYLKSPFLGFLDISILFFLVFLNVFYFFRISRVAGWLLIPYLIWIFYALLLNAKIWMLNR